MLLYLGCCSRVRRVRANVRRGGGSCGTGRRPSSFSREAAFAVGADRSVAAVGVPVGAGQVTSLVGVSRVRRRHRRSPCRRTGSCARSATANTPWARAADSSWVARATRQRSRSADPTDRSALAGSPGVLVLAGAVPPVVGADPVGAHDGAVEQGEVAVRPGQRPQRGGQAAAQSGPARPRPPGRSGRPWPARRQSRRPAGCKCRRCAGAPAPAEPGRGQAASARYAGVPGGPAARQPGRSGCVRTA